MRLIILLTFTICLSFQVFASDKENKNTLSITKEKNNQQILKIEKIPNISVDLNTPTNFYLLLLPFITIAFVLGSTIVTIKTINIKTTETKNSFIESLRTQREISENEVRAKILSASRQGWINTLRNELSEFISILHQIQIDIELNKGKPVTESFSNLISQSELRAAKIFLLINPNEPDHKELVELIKLSLYSEEKTYKQTFDLSEKIVSLSQKILKDEWNVLKGFK